MSAQVLLSMIAPALPAIPQGSSAGDAMGFEGLLAAMMDSEASSDATDLDALAADPAANDDAPSAASAILVAAPPPPSPVVLVTGLDAAAPPPADDAAAGTSALPPALPMTDAGRLAPDLAAQAQAPAPAPAKAPQDAEARTDAAPPSAEAVAENAVPAQNAAARTVSPQGVSGQDVSGQDAPAPKAPVETAPAQAASTRPVVAEAQPALAVSPVADRPATAKAAATLPAPPTADAPVADDAQPAAPPPAAAAKTVVDAAPAPQPVPVPPSQPAPQPALRALAERTSKPLDAAPAADGAGVADPRAAAPAASGSVAPSDGLADAPSSPVEAAPVVAPDAAGAETPDEPAPAAHTAREAAAPTLSRAAIDATAQIAAQILRKLDGRATRFEMALTPDDLGRVDVKLDIDAEGRLSARLAFDNPAAAADLRGRADDLRRELQQAGFHVADDAFEFAERDSGSSAFDRGPSDPGQDARDGQARAFARASRLTAEADARLQPPQGWTSHSLTPSGVDLKV